MIKNILEEQKNNKIINTVIISLNIFGLLILIYFAIPYLCHTNSLNGYSHNTCGFIVLLGLIPLLVTNILSYIYIKCNKKLIKILLFLPSALCIYISSLYLMTVQTESSDNQITTFRCYSNNANKYYYYEVKEENNKLVIKKEDKRDKIDLSIIDTTSTESIDKSLQSYYKKHNGFCP